MTAKDRFHFFRIELLLFAEALFSFCEYSIYMFLEIPISWQMIFVSTMLALLVWLITFIPNMYAYFFRHQRHFQSVLMNMGNAESNSKYKVKAIYPPVEKQLLRKTPSGIVFGGVGKNYVCKPIEQDGHVFVIGGSGSGKSSCVVIPTLLANPEIPVFAIDIKGELHKKATKKGDKNVLVFDPSDRMSYGYNPFFLISKSSTNQEIYETMLLVTQSLIPMPADVKDPFWKLSARSLLIGLLIYYFNLNFDNLIDIIDQIMSKPIKNSIEDVLKNSPPTSNEYKYIVEFQNMADVTLSGIFLEMSLHLNVFAVDADIRFAFRDNDLQLSPEDLEEGKSIFLAIREDKLGAYYDVLQLIINQMLSLLEKRPEDSTKILFMIDELPRILSSGKIEKLMDATHTLRSRNVTLMLITQSVEALMTAFTENEVVDLISNCAYIEVLSASSTKTQEMVQNWCGQYKEKKVTRSGGVIQSEHFTMEDKNIVQPVDLMRLQMEGEAILISPYGYFRIRKTPYYKNKGLNLLAQEVKENNGL